MQTNASSRIGRLWLIATATLLLSAQIAQTAEIFAPFHQPTGDWYEAGDATLKPDQNGLLVGKPGTGVLINGKTGRTNSLVTKASYQDVQVHVEFMFAKGSNSGVIFHGNYEIQILDSADVEKPTGADCGGIYPRAEGKPGTPSYHHIDAGSPPRINAARAPGQWQTLDIIFQSPRFDASGNKTANARFVRVVLNGIVVQENKEVPYAHGPNWDRKQFPSGPVIFQGDYGPIALRNVHVKPWDGKSNLLNIPPEGFTALFNGKDFTGWNTPPDVLKEWSTENGVLKSYGLVDHWRASLVTKRLYRDFILMLDFRMPTISDSGICFRRLIPEIPGFGNMEQFNLRSRGGMGHLESYYFLPKETAEKMGLKEEEKPHVRHIDPKVGVWHTVKLTMRGRGFSAEYDGEILHDNFRFHDWMLSMEPAPIMLQKHRVVHGDNLGAENPCPIEFRNIFIKDLGSPNESAAARTPSSDSQRRQTARRDATARSSTGGNELLARIDKTELPREYDPARHQQYVDRQIAVLTNQQRARLSQLWKEKQKIDPNMPNRGVSFVRILTYVAADERLSAAGRDAKPGPDVAAPVMPKADVIPERSGLKPVNRWKWSATADAAGVPRKAAPLKLSDGRTISAVVFESLEADKTPVVLLPGSRLRVRGRLTTAHAVEFGVTMRHPDGDFAGRFLAERSADAFQNGKEFDVTVRFEDFQLDPSLAGMRAKLPSAPFHFVVEAIWITTREQRPGLEIAQVELLP